MPSKEMGDDQDTFRYEVEFSFNVAVDDDDHVEPTAFVHRVSGAIMQHNWSDDDSSPLKIGTLSVVVMDVEGGVNAGFNAFDIIDSFDAESSSYGQMLYDENGNVLEEISDEFPNAGYIGRVVILESMKIEPEFRGREIGLLVARKALMFFGCGSFMILKPFPLQFSQYNDPAWVPPKGVRDKDKAFEKARKKLERYWKRLGCREIGKSGYLGMDTTEALPTVKEVRARKRQAKA